MPWPKSLILNKGNAMQMAAAFGDDTDQWPGSAYRVWAENVMFQGKFAPGIKVQPATAAALPARIASVAAQTAPNGAGSIIDDAILFRSARVWWGSGVITARASPRCVATSGAAMVTLDQVLALLACQPTKLGRTPRRLDGIHITPAYPGTTGIACRERTTENV